MKTIVLGDTHGRSNWKLAVHQDNPDRVIFIGDYFDSFNIKGEEQLNNFLDIIEYKKTSGKEVIMLIGNHDHHYFPEVGDTGTSGY
jgi:metallophosphoesterase superfamily enzyme